MVESKDIVQQWCSYCMPWLGMVKYDIIIILILGVRFSSIEKDLFYTISQAAAGVTGAGATTFYTYYNKVYFVYPDDVCCFADGLCLMPAQ